jgi:hypothetical protein
MVRVPLWTGREVRALRQARRMSVREFAAHLGVSDRMVSKWESGGRQIIPRPTNQTALDYSLTRTDPDQRARFAAAIHPSSAAGPVAPPILAGAVTGIVRHPHDTHPMALIDAGFSPLGPHDTPTWQAGFFIDVYPVTNAAYAVFLDATGHRPPAAWPGTNPDTAQHPVVGVSWHDAAAYCHWAGKTLPTGAQWEKAARGPHGTAYPWGDQADAAHSNVRESRIRTTTAVGWWDNGTSVYGVHDLCGNIWEWTTTPDEAGHRQARGGAFTTPAHLTNPAAWVSWYPSTCRDDLGFRGIVTIEAMMELLLI